MARCSHCGAKGAYRKVNRQRLCPTCHGTVIEARRAELLAGPLAGEVTEYCVIGGIKMRDPDSPTYWRLVGSLFCTDRGLIFLQASEYSRQNGSPLVLLLMLAAIAFWPLVLVIMVLNDDDGKARKKFQNGDARLFAGAVSIDDMVRRAQRVLYWSWDEIDAFRVSGRMIKMRIDKTVTPMRMLFPWPDVRVTLEECRVAGRERRRPSVAW